MSQTTVISCQSCNDKIGESAKGISPPEVKCVKCIRIPGIFQEMGADPENKTNLFSRGFDTTENY